jgi:hypothetical protein
MFHRSRIFHGPGNIQQRGRTVQYNRCLDLFLWEGAKGTFQDGANRLFPQDRRDQRYRQRNDMGAEYFSLEVPASAMINPQSLPKFDADNLRKKIEWIGDPAKLGLLRINAHGDGAAAQITAEDRYVNMEQLADLLIGHGLTAQQKGLKAIYLAVCEGAQGTRNSSMIGRLANALKSRNIPGVKIIGAYGKTAMIAGELYVDVPGESEMKKVAGQLEFSMIS